MTLTGGDGLVAARHLKHFGFEVLILYPKQHQRFANLVAQCQDLDIPILSSAGNLVELIEMHKINLVVDAIFGFSFEGPIRLPFSELIAGFSTLRVPILSVDIPSG